MYKIRTNNLKNKLLKSHIPNIKLINNLIVTTKGENNTQITIKYISTSTGYIRTKGINTKIRNKPNKINLPIF